MPQKLEAPARDTSAQVNRARAADKSTPHSQNVSDRLFETLIDNLRVLQRDANPQTIGDYTSNPYYKSGYDLDKKWAEAEEGPGPMMQERSGFLMPAPQGMEYQRGSGPSGEIMNGDCTTDQDCQEKFGLLDLDLSKENPYSKRPSLVRMLLQRQGNK